MVESLASRVNNLRAHVFLFIQTPQTKADQPTIEPLSGGAGPDQRDGIISIRNNLFRLALLSRDAKFVHLSH
jgi:hypothetical protein